MQLPMADASELILKEITNKTVVWFLIKQIEELLMLPE
jgi:hypothetical protein